MSEKTFTAVATIDELPPESKKCVSVNGIPILLCHTQGRIFAVRNECSHAEAALEPGRMRAGWIACPIHGARFDLETGEALNPPASSPIDVFEVRIEGDTIAVAV